MPSTFDKREKAHEAKYVRDKELAFKVNARRNKLLGLWAAELMGLAGEDAEAYAKQTVMADFDAPGDEDVFLKVKKDLGAADVDVSDHDLRRKMESLLKTAAEQVESEAASG